MFGLNTYEEVLASGHLVLTKLAASTSSGLCSLFITTFLSPRSPNKKSQKLFLIAFRDELLKA